MKSRLIGHRGEPETWPENSLLGFQSVLEAGACYIETDIQVSADGIAILIHDASALRITGTDLPVTATDYKILRSLSAGYPQRFGDQYRALHIARLDELVELLCQWPQARAFIEIKDESIAAHGIDTVAEIVMQTISPVLQQCILISFNYEALVYIREHHQHAVGWVLREWSTDSNTRAMNLEPQYLFCKYQRLPEEAQPLWPGPWQWAVYTVNSASDVVQLLQRGVTLVETNVISQLLTHPDLECLDSA